MKSFVLTGGIGAGKSSVLTHFVDLGVEPIDADRTVSELQQPGQVVFEQIRQRFGKSVVAADGELDRPALAEIVFGDPSELSDLESIVHPAVKHSIESRLEVLRAGSSSADTIVIIDVPLVVNRENLYGVDGLIVVDCPIETVVERLVKYRGLTVEGAQARIDNQISRIERLELADFVIDNGGSYTELELEMQRCWDWMSSFR